MAQAEVGAGRSPEGYTGFLAADTADLAADTADLDEEYDLAEVTQVTERGTPWGYRDHLYPGD